MTVSGLPIVSFMTGILSASANHKMTQFGSIASVSVLLVIRLSSWTRRVVPAFQPADSITTRIRTSSLSIHANLEKIEINTNPFLSPPTQKDGT